MSNFSKTDYASARRQVHELAWQEYLKTQGSTTKTATKTQSKISRALDKLIFWH